MPAARARALSFSNVIDYPFYKSRYNAGIPMTILAFEFLERHLEVG